jgi:uncharacterized protein
LKEPVEKIEIAGVQHPGTCYRHWHYFRVCCFPKGASMKKYLALFALCFTLLAAGARAQDAKKIKAVMYVGGGFHDYKTMPGVLAAKIIELANISIDIKPVADAPAMVAVFKDPKFGEGYDVIIYDICYGEAWADGDYDGALNAAKAGKPAVFLHCSMHTYRPPRDTKDPKLAEREAIADAKWHALVGMDTRVHDRFEGFATVKVDKDNPITKSFPDDWKTTGDELYNTVKMMPTAKPLLQVKSPQSGNTHTCAWTNMYGNTRIFATTLGHDMKTGADPEYHKLLAYGILWSVDKLGADGKPLPGYAGTK